MTRKTTDFSNLLYYNPATHGFNPVVEATIHCPDSMNEYDSIVVNVVTWNLPDGDLFWRVVPYGTNLTPGRFTLGSSDSTPLVNDRASFTIAVSADNATSPDGQSFDIIVSKTLNGPAIATKYGVNVNDTSQDPQLLVMDLDPANYQPAGSSTISVTTTYQSEYCGFPDNTGGSYIRYNGDIATQPSVGDTFVYGGTTYTVAQVMGFETFGTSYQYYFAGFKPTIGQGAIGVGETIDFNHSSDGLSIRDASGQGHTGLLNAAPTFTTGGTNGDGNYFTLNGTSQYIVVPSLQSSAYTSVTMMLWFNPSNTDGSLITKELSYKMRLNSSHFNVMAKSSSAGGWNYNSTDNSVTVDNNWHHIAVTIASDFIDWYYDGTSFHHEASPGLLHANLLPLMIGSYGMGTSEFFTGKIGPARLYNYALSSSDISTYYNATKDRYQAVANMSFVFNGSTDYKYIFDALSDWDFSVTDNFTVEFWSKAASSSASSIFTVLCQGPQNGIDVFYDSGYLRVFNGHDDYISWVEPTPGVWTHVAIMNAGGTVYAFYNGVQQTVTSGAWVPGYHWGNGIDPLAIGKRGGVGGQNFNGKLTGIRITGNVQYIDVMNIQNFYPYSQSLPPTKVLGTKLLLNPTSTAMLDDLSDSNHSFGPGNVGQSDDYPGLITYVAQYSTDAPPGVTNTNLAFFSVFTTSVIGWTMTGPDVPPGTTVLTQTSTSNQTFITISNAINYHNVEYTFIAP